MRRFAVLAFALTTTVLAVSIKAAQNAPAPAGGGAPAAAGDIVTLEGTTLKGSISQGKLHYTFGNTSCTNCHGLNAVGAFGKELAGRNLTYEYVHNAIRNGSPTGMMPAFDEANVTDQEIADLVAYWNSLPPSTGHLKWRTELPPNAPVGQQLAVALIGCAQCHGATMDTPRHGAAEAGGDFEWFKNMVYHHTTQEPKHWAALDPAIPHSTPGPSGPPGRNRIRMGNYNPMITQEVMLKVIFDWISDLGFLPPLTTRVTAGAPAADGVTYTIEVFNAGMKGKGLGAEGVNVEVALPAGTEVKAGTGLGYAVKMDEKTKGPVVTWKFPKMIAGDVQKVTFTAAAAVPGFRGELTWDKPVVKADPEVRFNFGNVGRGGGPAD